MTEGVGFGRMTRRSSTKPLSAFPRSLKRAVSESYLDRFVHKTKWNRRYWVYGICATFCVYVVLMNRDWGGSEQTPVVGPLLEACDEAAFRSELLYSSAQQDTYSQWLEKQMKMYWTHMCKQKPFKVESFEEHYHAEQEYIDTKLLPTLPSYNTAAGRLYKKKKGVVFTSRKKSSDLAFVMRTVGLMKKFNRQHLPVELWTGTGKPLEDKEICQGEYDITCRDFFDPGDLGFKLDLLPAKAYEWCVYVAFFSGFEEVIVLDLDAVPMGDISHLFDSPMYRETGQLFYADYWGTGSYHYAETVRYASPVWDFVRTGQYYTNEQESSILVLNKAKIWRELNLVLHLTRYRQLMAEPAPRGYPHVIWGDKDVWRLSWLYLRKTFYMAMPFALGFVSFGFFCFGSFGHIGVDTGRVLFVHQPKLLESPYVEYLTNGIVNLRCPGYDTYSGHKCRHCLVSELHKYNYKTGTFSPELRSYWTKHECIESCNHLGNESYAVFKKTKY